VYLHRVQLAAAWMTQLVNAWMVLLPAVMAEGCKSMAWVAVAWLARLEAACCTYVIFLN